MMRLAQQSLARVPLNRPPPPHTPNLPVFYPGSILKILHVDSDWYYLSDLIDNKEFGKF